MSDSSVVVLFIDALTTMSEPYKLKTITQKCMILFEKIGSFNENSDFIALLYQSQRNFAQSITIH